MGNALTPLLLIALMIFPATALVRAGGDNRWIFGYAALISVVTYFVYAWDKRRARAGEWRVAEARLHLLEILGGWPGAFVAQRRLRHKCSKGSYQFVFWLIVIGYQFAAIDALMGWQISGAVVNWVSSAVSTR
ncbi:MAG TPA: DUF1294 domain-containing protein [Oceanipulchritudo sp.]|nr:DUF1294 domain-containing protein [Oceanipulchritudo sp.]